MFCAMARILPVPGWTETSDAPHLSGLAPAVASTWACAAACSLLSSVVVMVRPPRYSLLSRSVGVGAVGRVVEDQVGDVVAEVRRHVRRGAALLAGAIFSSTPAAAAASCSAWVILPWLSILSRTWLRRLMEFSGWAAGS